MQLSHGRRAVFDEPDLASSDGVFPITTEPTLFRAWRFHAFFTTTPPEQADTVQIDQTHRRHAIIENVAADNLKHSALRAPGLRVVRRQYGMVGVGVQRFQPDPRRRDHRLRFIDLGHYRNDPPHPGPDTLINVPTRVSCIANTRTLHLPTYGP